MKLFNHLLKLYITILRGKFDFPKTREVSPSPIREVQAEKKPVVESLSCPYCLSRNFQKRGFRQKKLERVQLYLCQNCRKTFTGQITKGKHYPLSVMLDAISVYNLGYSLEQTCRIVNRPAPEVTTEIAEARHQSRGDIRSKDKKRSRRWGVQPSTLSNWLRETKELCKFSRMREFAVKMYPPQGMVISATLAHRQLYRYRFHQAKCELIISEDFKHHRFGPLQEFLQMVPVECPHQYFQEGLRASEAPLTFSKKQMVVRAKQNYATRLAEFVLQSVKERKLRHETLQKFMLYNDSVTVATEVPVYITKDDLEHMKTQLGFQIYIRNQISKISNIQSLNPFPKLPEVANESLPKDATTTATAAADVAEIASLPKLITGHIDILQIRNGQIHILDYKARAEKERPIEQLTLYAMALSRLTGLRLFEFRCAWFDENDYFEFYPLHVLHKPKKNRRRRKVYTMEGVYQINRNADKIESIRPIL